MLIHGYEDDPLIAGEGLLSLPGIWAAYLMWLCQTEEDPEAAWFGVDEADVDAAYEALSQEDRWPTFRIPFTGGHSAVVLQRNHPDEPGVEYLVTHPTWDRTGHLATLDGHQAGPGLAWQELVHIARTPETDKPGVHDPHARLLLLLPALGDCDLPDDAAEVLGGALRWAGVTEDGTEKVLEALLWDHPYWERASWSLPGASPLSGSQAPFFGILSCDEPGSPRCGVRLAQGIRRDQSDRLAMALGIWPST